MAEKRLSPQILFFGKWRKNVSPPKFCFLENGGKTSPPPNSVFWKMAEKRLLPQIPFFGIWGRLGGGLFAVPVTLRLTTKKIQKFKPHFIF
jgi:hypothetical protein